MNKLFQGPHSLKPRPMDYCPGCGHGIIHRLVAEAIDELGIQERALGVPPTGCAMLIPDYLDVDMGEAPHGRAVAVATGLKRVLPDCVVFAYQGDGDIAAMGIGEVVHAAARGENLTVIFVNNATYGMTGGQMAPTTLLGMDTTTTPGGRDLARDGAPLDLTQMLASVQGAAYLERVAVASPELIRQAKEAIQKAFQIQLDGMGFALVEVLSPCPFNWHMTPAEAFAWTEQEMTKVYPLGVIKDITAKGGQAGARP